MKYRINGHVLFDADSGSLSLMVFSDDPLAVSNPTKRLLLLLIINHGEPVSREVIFRKVWDDYGMVSSNNNLNQCVSKLRRILKTLGIEEEVIITVPKVGFMLSRDIAIECVDELPATSAMAEENIIATSLPDRLPAVEPCVAPPCNNRRPWRRWAAIGVALVLLIALAVGMTIYFTGYGRNQERFIGATDRCKVFMSTSGQAFTSQGTFNRDILSYANTKPGDCNADEYILVVRSNQVHSYISGISRLFLLKCKILREYRLEICYGLQDEQLH
ncbi:winged helix-turn-helix domain-containing protein [Serratia sp. AKBS12]|uniref:winged helix-turn-helix domain-containing protein n=1 Tax=Serratia sp. AKBS12 TaxID=2974597 RepID=UPI0021664AB7|nr:winged helix-turn-helix domain-containing protein [Serratia sp. AKBS12]MCS3409447.1 winged helix-turn-helix domain-containing protein [Serratia sp. AKBS12]